MSYQIEVQLRYQATKPCDLLLQIEAARTADQQILSGTLSLKPNSKMTRIVAEEDFGERIWLSVNSQFDCSYNAVVSVDRIAADMSRLRSTPLKSIPSDVIKYLMASRYCHLDDFHEFVSKEFKGLEGGKLISAASDWIKSNFKYANDVSNSSTTAYDSFRVRRGVCRDFAHVLISIARSAAIPARIVSVYAPDVSPQDFHAVVEVYLDGVWHLIDPTGMAKPDEVICIGVGRDAADIAFMTSYGWLELQTQSVQVTRN